ncbi:MAG: nuclease-related domain-containing protein [Desulfobacteraceae bacterium]|nr:nuclease-related domain-containing protein [Desulfobacteraceae bacterium]
MLAVLNLIRRRIRLRSLRPSFKQDLLRIPGGSLLMRLDNLNEQINLYLAYVITLPLIVYSALISYSYFQANQPSLTVIWMSSVISIALITYMVFKLVKLLSRRKRIRLAYEGELVVGQELNQLMLHGYSVYHDFPADTFNIDHIIVGAKGVFAVETRTRSKGAVGNRSQGATVTYDGRMLTFADITDFETIEQAQQQADWLSKWLGAATGEPIAVRAVVTLPGWVVKRTSADGIPVVNPGQFASLFEHIKPRPLSGTMLNHIKDHLEQKCRNY